MAQQQDAADVHLDELCPPNKRYDLMDANKKVDLEHFWHTLKEDGSKNRLKFLLDRKELTLTLDNFRTIFHLPQANDNNHASFMPPPSFSDMVPFYKQVLGFTMELKTVSNFKITGRNKNKVRMRIPAWMITDEMKLTKHYKMYAEVFGLAVPLTQQSARLTPHVLVPSAEKANEMILQDTIQVSLAEHKSHKEQEARENVALIMGECENVEILLNHNPNQLDLYGFILIRILRYRETTGIDGYSLIQHLIKFNLTEEELQDVMATCFAHIVARFMPRKSFDTLADKLHEVMVETLPSYSLIKHIKDQVVKAKFLNNSGIKFQCNCRRVLSSGEAKRLKKRTERLNAKAIFLSGGQHLDKFLQEEQAPSTSDIQEQDDILNFRLTSPYASRLLRNSNKQVSQDIIEEVARQLEEAKLIKIA
ncbi:hypothetical protein Tco_0309927 [Tanacetum coccineum]